MAACINNAAERYKLGYHGISSYFTTLCLVCIVILCPQDSLEQNVDEINQIKMLQNLCFHIIASMSHPRFLSIYSVVLDKDESLTSESSDTASLAAAVGP